MWKSRGNCSGFTLIEVMIALLILSLAFFVSVGAIDAALSRLQDDIAERSALMFGQSLRARIGADIPLMDGVVQGHEGALAWSVVTEPWNPSTGTGNLDTSQPAQAHSVTVSVSWPARRGVRSVSVRTLILEGVD